MSLRWSLMGSGRGQGWPFGYRLDGTRDSALLTDSGLLEDDGEGDQLVCGAEACHPIFAHEDMGEHDCGGAAVVYWPSPIVVPRPHLRYYWLISSPVFAEMITRDRFEALQSRVHFSDNEDPHADTDRLWKL